MSRRAAQIVNLTVATVALLALLGVVGWIEGMN